MAPSLQSGGRNPRRRIDLGHMWSPELGGSAPLGSILRAGEGPKRTRHDSHRVGHQLTLSSLFSHLVGTHLTAAGRRVGGRRRKRWLWLIAHPQQGSRTGTGRLQLGLCPAGAVLGGRREPCPPPHALYGPSSPSMSEQAEARPARWSQRILIMECNAGAGERRE